MSQHAIAFFPNNKIQVQEELCSCEKCLLGMFDSCIYPIMLQACSVRVYLRTRQFR